MKRLDLRKYIFPYVAVVFVCYFICKCIGYSLQPHSPASENDFFGDEIIIVAWFLISSIGILVSFVLMIFEILVRKYIIKKYFPNFKVNVDIRIPKFITIILSIIFYIGLVIAVLLGVLLLFLVFPYDTFN